MHASQTRMSLACCDTCSYTLVQNAVWVSYIGVAVCRSCSISSIKTTRLYRFDETKLKILIERSFEFRVESVVLNVSFVFSPRRSDDFTISTKETHQWTLLTNLPPYLELPLVGKYLLSSLQSRVKFARVIEHRKERTERNLLRVT